MIDHDPRVRDILLEYLNIGMGKAGDVLNSMLTAHIRLQVPELRLIHPQELRQELGISQEDCLSLVRMGYSGPIEGKVELIFTRDNASKLVNALTGEGFEDMDMDTIRSGTLCEVGNIVINALMGTLSNLLAVHLVYSVPEYREGSNQDLIHPGKQDTAILLAKTNFEIEALEISGNLAVYFSLLSFQDLMDRLSALLEA